MHFSGKEWQLRLSLNGKPNSTANERQTETTEESDTRFEYDRARHREQTVQSSLPLFQQCSIQAKMQTSHANMATLDITIVIWQKTTGMSNLQCALLNYPIHIISAVDNHLLFHDHIFPWCAAYSLVQACMQGFGKLKIELKCKFRVNPQSFSLCLSTAL